LKIINKPFIDEEYTMNNNTIKREPMSKKNVTNTDLTISKTKGKLQGFLCKGVESLAVNDPRLFSILEDEYQRQQNRLMMVASSSLVDPSVLACEASTPVNVTAEGYPGMRYHGGCENIDKIEQLAIDRAMHVFNARYANVQPHSATTANLAVIASLLKANDTILGMDLTSGGHLTHGSSVSFSGTYFNAIGYGLDTNGYIDYFQVEELARKFKPKLIICGTTAYSRVVDFKRFREISDWVGAYLLADISHIAGLVAAGLHPSPIDHAHVTTTCTHKQLFGPRGGLILIGKDFNTIMSQTKHTFAQHFQKAIFPFFQGAPVMNNIAAKARTFAIADTQEFKDVMGRVLQLSRILAATFAALGYKVVSGGTDTHIVLIDTSPLHISGFVIEKALEESYIIVNKNRVPGDKTPHSVTSGIRLGTNSLAMRGFTSECIKTCANLIHHVIQSIQPLGDKTYRLDTHLRDNIRQNVLDLCARFPIPSYP
jgi:glycine hydroxymethyltransferase